MKMTNFPSLARKLHDWHKKHRREHLFRQNRTPYSVWISEVALQQTRIGAAAERLKHFLSVFPTLESLAQAPEESVVEAFAGLGYYNRARNLAKGARYFQETWGKLPESYEELLKAPSIGPYTAAAISSICFGQKQGVIDGNVKRIIARLLALSASPGQKSFEKECATFMQNYINALELDAGFLNEAFMELGQEICTVKSPRCALCPVENLCKAKENPLAYPVQMKKPEKIEVDWHAMIITNPQGRILVQKYSDFRFLKEMWGFPSVLSIHGQATIQKEHSHRALAQAHIDGATFDQGPKHTITRHKIQFFTKVFEGPDSAAILKIIGPPTPDELEWITPNEASRRLASSAMKKVLAAAKTSL